MKFKVGQLSQERINVDLFDEVKRLKQENVLLKADNEILKAKWELQGLMIQKLHKETALKSIVNETLSIFPKSFINKSNELILEPKNNIYFRLDDVETELDFKCKMFAWVSRPIAKGLNNHWSTRVLNCFNYLLCTKFTKEDMLKIYDRLGNDVNRQLTIKFIESDYDLSLLERN